jgi:DNA topoisomerase-1
MDILLIVESPTKQTSFEKYLKDQSDRYTIASSKGHIRDLAIRGEGGFGVEIEQCFKPTYRIIKGKEAIVKELQKAAKKVDKVILATDPDREGESIAWHLADALELDVEKTERIEFYEINKEKIIDALSRPRKINMDMVQSQEARRILDRIVGFMLSKILNKKVYAPAGGRVQSVALRFVIEREMEVLAFQPQTYFTLESDLQTPTGALPVETIAYQNQSLRMSDDKTDPSGYRKLIPLATEAIAQGYQQKLPKEVTLSEVTITSKKKESRAAFRTSTLQQEASSHKDLRFSPKRTQMVAQSLYEGVTIDDENVGLITYIRTDSDRLSDGFITEASDYITKQFGSAYLSDKPKAKTAILQSQDAHEAIRPTSLSRTPDSVQAYLTVDQLKLYRLIYARSLASLMTAKQYDVTTYTFKGNDFTLKAQGSVVTFEGYTKVFPVVEEDEGNQLPQLYKGQTFPLTFKEIKIHHTAGPSRYSEAKLIQEMEYRGIGRPSTYAAIIARLKDHHYVSVKSHTLYPNPEAHAAMKYLMTFFQYLVNPTYTSQMELKLDEVKDGEVTRCDLLNEFYNHFKQQYQQAGDLPTDDPALTFYGKCPKPGCPGIIVPRRSRFGVFLGCSKYPTCDFVSNDVPLPWQKENPLEGEDSDEDGPTKQAGVFQSKKPVAEPIGKDCPLCGKPLIKRFAKRGGRPFVGCSGFPSCRHLENLDGTVIVLKERPAKVSKVTKKTKKAPKAKKA